MTISPCTPQVISHRNHTAAVAAHDNRLQSQGVYMTLLDRVRALALAETQLEHAIATFQLLDAGDVGDDRMQMAARYVREAVHVLRDATTALENHSE